MPKYIVSYIQEYEIEAESLDEAQEIGNDIRDTLTADRDHLSVEELS